MKSVLVVVMGLISLFSAGCTSPVIKSPEDPAHATVEQQPSPLREATPAPQVMNQQGTPVSPAGTSPFTDHGNASAVTGTGYTHNITLLPQEPSLTQTPGTRATVPATPRAVLSTPTESSIPVQPLVPVSIPIPSLLAIPGTTIVPPFVPVSTTPAISPTTRLT